MFFVLGADGQEYGPAARAQIRAWQREGRANEDTLVRYAGAPDWQRLADFPEFQPNYVPPTGPLHGVARLTVLGAFERSWELFRENTALLLGASAAYAGLQLLVALSDWASLVYSFLLSGVLLAGLSLVFLRRYRHQPTAFTDLFAGFRANTRPLILATFLTTAVEGIAGLPLLLTWADWASFPLWVLVLSGLGVLYVNVAYLFVFPLMMDRGLSPLEALQQSRRLTLPHTPRLLGFAVLSALLLFLGLLLFFAGLAFALPLIAGAYVHLYLQLCGEEA